MELSASCCNDTGEDEETKKQKQKALIDAAFKTKTENAENSSVVDGDEESGDGTYSVKSYAMHLYYLSFQYCSAGRSLQWKQRFSSRSAASCHLQWDLGICSIGCLCGVL